MISQLIVLSPRGDVIILKDFKGNVSKSSHEVLFKAINSASVSSVSSVSSSSPTAGPAFCIDGTNYAYIHAGSLYWGVTTRENVSPSLLVELLNRLFWIAKTKKTGTAICVFKPQSILSNNFKIFHV